MFHVSTVNAIYEIQSHMNKAFLKDLDQLYKTYIYIVLQVNGLIAMSLLTSSFSSSFSRVA